MSNAAPIDLDDPTTWPPATREWAQNWAEREVSLDPIPVGMLEQEAELRASLSGHKLRAYHCTCLLEHEVASIRAGGLRRLTRELVDERLQAAVAAGALTVEQRAQLAETTAYAHNDHRNRDGQVCLILGRSVLDSEADGCDPLLSTWGGEAIYRGAGDPPELLERIGRPALVVCAIEVGDAKAAWTFSLGSPFVAKLRGEEPGAEVFYRRDVAAVDVLDVWQPGHPEYDRHVALPAR